jgi:hypothetical protein
MENAERDLYLWEGGEKRGRVGEGKVDGGGRVSVFINKVSHITNNNMGKKVALNIKTARKQPQRSEPQPDSKL